MAQLTFRNPGDPPKKESTRRHLLHRKIKRNILIALYLVQTIATVYFYVRR